MIILLIIHLKIYCLTIWQYYFSISVIFLHILLFFSYDELTHQCIIYFITQLLLIRPPWFSLNKNTILQTDLYYLQLTKILKTPLLPRNIRLTSIGTIIFSLRFNLFFLPFLTQTLESSYFKGHWNPHLMSFYTKMSLPLSLSYFLSSFLSFFSFSFVPKPNSFIFSFLWNFDYPF